MTRRVLVTGAAGFIGSAVVRHLLDEAGAEVIGLDKLTYAGHRASLDEVRDHPRFRFEQACILDSAHLDRVFAEHRPGAVMHLAAETHVDRSIEGPLAFVATNVTGTATLLEAALAFWRGLEGEAREAFRFHHVSTDEVYGSLPLEGEERFTEETPHRPNSPYAASKAASDHLVRAWHHTYGLPVVTSNCSNNYGPRQTPEKLIPLMILNGLEERPLPVYGRGDNVRDWLHVEDHARALALILERGRVGETYNVGGDAEVSNLGVVETLCGLLDARRPSPVGPRRRLIGFVADRPGHDQRYAVDTAKIRRELGWRPRESFASGLARTVDWYLDNEGWWGPLRQVARERRGLAGAGSP